MNKWIPRVILGFFIIWILINIDFAKHTANMAANRNNPELCKIVPTLNQFRLAYMSPRTSTYDCYLKVALAHKNLEACKLSGRINGDRCYEKVAKKFEDKSICEYINPTLTAMKDDCYEHFTN